MTFRASTFFSLLAILLPLVTASHWGRRHHGVAHRARSDVNVHRRQYFDNARFTFYDVGLGACGKYSIPSDFIVAINVPQYGNGYPGPLCFKPITIQYGGKTAQATIMDECEACPYAGLDFSRGLFDYFAPESEGVIYGAWYFNDGSSGGGGGQTSALEPQTTPDYTPTTTNTPDYTPPTTTSTPDYAPPTTTNTPDYTPPTTSDTPTYTPSVTPTSSSTSSTPSTSSNSSSTFSLSEVAAPTGSVIPVPDSNNPENIFVINNIMVEIGIALFGAERVD